MVAPCTQTTSTTFHSLPALQVPYHSGASPAEVVLERAQSAKSAPFWQKLPHMHTLGQVPIFLQCHPPRPCTFLFVDVNPDRRFAAYLQGDPFSAVAEAFAVMCMTGEQAGQQRSRAGTHDWRQSPGLLRCIWACAKSAYDEPNDVEGQILQGSGESANKVRVKF